LILSDRTLECASCHRRVACHTSWARTETGHYVIVGWLLRNLRPDALVDEPGPDELGLQVSPREIRRGWFRGSVAPPSVALRPRFD
jgi:hypothetical protein